MSNQNEKSFIANLVSNPTSFSILVLSAVILIVWLDQRDSGRQQTVSAPATTPIAPAAPNTGSAPNAPAPTGNGTGNAPPLSMKGPSINNRDTPRILNDMGSAPSGDAGKLSAPDLGGLLAGLEAKVKADPDNLSKRLLLAQTYNELGMADKALVELREMRKENPDHARVNLVLASILSSSDEKNDIENSLKILDQLSGDETVQQYLVHMYKGNALIRTQDHEGALSEWKTALSTMPEADNRRAMLEQRISDLSKKGS